MNINRRGLGGGGRHRGQAEEQHKRGDKGPYPAEDTSPDLRSPIPARHSPLLSSRRPPTALQRNFRYTHGTPAHMGNARSLGKWPMGMC